MNNSTGVGMKYSTVSGLILALILLSSEALACSCDRGEGGGWRESFRALDLIFEGRAISTTTLDPDGDDTDEELMTVFEIGKAIKGGPQATRTIYHGRGMCGVEFDPSEVYIVKANRSVGKFYTGGCFGNRPVRESDQDQEYKRILEQLGEDSTEDEREHVVMLLYINFDNLLSREFENSYAMKFESLHSENAQIGVERLLQLGDYATRWRDYERAANAYMTASKIVPNDTTLVVKMAGALIELDRWDELIEPLTHAAKVDPTSLRVRTLLAQARLLVEGRADHVNRDYRGIPIVGRNLDDLSGYGFDFSTSQINGSNFANSVLHDARFDDAIINDTNFKGSHLEGASFSGARVDRWRDTTTSFEGADLGGASLIRTEFHSSNFNKSDLNHVAADHMTGAGASFVSAKMTGASFRYGSFRRANFTDADFADADFSHTDLSRAILLSANLERAGLKGADLLGAKINCKTMLPTGLDQTEAGLIPIEAACDGVSQNRDFSNKDWKRVDFSKLDLEGADFTNATFSYVKFLNAILQKADFSSTVAGQGFSGADFSQSDLTEASFRNASSVGYFGAFTASGNEGASFGVSILDRTDFTGAKLDTRNFVAYSGAVNEYSDLSTAVFQDVSYTCPYSRTTDSSWEEERLAKLRAGKSENDIPDEEISQKYRDERIRFLEDRIAEKKRYIANERSLVTFFAEKWPGTKFDASCQVYLDKIEG